jgi:anti-anti-sigma regulatory factor
MGFHLSSLGPGTVEIALTGTLSEQYLDRLRSVLLDSRRSAARVLVDLSKVEAIDAAGVALLMLARIEIEARGGTFVVQAPASSARRIVDRGLARFATVVRDRTSALAALMAPAAA